MKYLIGMNVERDPITEWEHAIERRLGAGIIVLVLAVLVGAMVAPAFGWWVKRTLYYEYAVYPDCEQRVKHTMKFVWVWLWLLAIGAWAFAIVCNR